MYTCIFAAGGGEAAQTQLLLVGVCKVTHAEESLLCH